MATHIRRPLGLAVALTTLAALAAGCSGEDSGGEKDDPAESAGRAGGPVVVATTTWEGAFAKAAGAEDITVIVPPTVLHAPDYEPKPSDLAAVAEADFVLYAPFEPFAGQITEAAGSDAELVEVNLDNGVDAMHEEVTRLAELFGTEQAAWEWTEDFAVEYDKLSNELRATWPDGTRPEVVAQVFTVWAADMANAATVETFGPEQVTPGELDGLTAADPVLVLDNAHLTTGEVLPGSGIPQVDIVNYPGEDLDLLAVYRDAAGVMREAIAGL
ncbi:metal ABC transporter solute-binding protein, Zn/Mn family [Streptomyces aidingensis]|uniref:Zinc transport system substrate-binding protein n=1 Tax=Streptomyces aidingensis TaxID=910347 RepID=A0A1I1N759_9ACTN|nr:zinc ABC transporter substrate-binding protein [Streptomyces aidingensis]SFC93467.1 zinc transport system substrate-binding protein [Streptomyces aidingensis]